MTLSGYVRKQPLSYTEELQRIITELKMMRSSSNCHPDATRSAAKGSGGPALGLCEQREARAGPPLRFAQDQDDKGSAAIRCCCPSNPRLLLSVKSVVKEARTPRASPQPPRRSRSRRTAFPPTSDTSSERNTRPAQGPPTTASRHSACRARRASSRRL